MNMECRGEVDRLPLPLVRRECTRSGILPQSGGLLRRRSKRVRRTRSTLLAALKRTVRIGWGWRQVVAFCLQLFLKFLDGAIELLIFAFELLPGIVVDRDV